MRTSTKKTFSLLILMALVVGAVILIFKVIQPLKVAALIAASLFLFISIFTIYSEIRWGRGKKSLAFITAVAFLIFFVVPILGLRLIYWNTDFQEIWIGSFRAQLLHEMSSRCYLLLVGTVVYEGIRPYLPGRKSRPASKKS